VASAKDASRTESTPPFDMTTPEGGYPSPVTSDERRLPVHERAPECVSISIANGQQSTNPTGASPFAVNGPGFGHHRSPTPKGRRTTDGRGRAGRLTNRLPGLDSAQQYQWAGVNQMVGQLAGRLTIWLELNRLLAGVTTFENLHED